MNPTKCQKNSVATLNAPEFWVPVMIIDRILTWHSYKMP